MDNTRGLVGHRNDSHPSAAAFTIAPGADYLVNSSNLFTINDIGPGETAMPDIANSLTVSDVQATLLFADGGAFDITTTLSLSGLLNLGKGVGGGDSTLSMGSSGAAGDTITLSPNGRIKGGNGDSIQNLGTSPTEISGSGTILANDGIFDIGTGVQIASTGAANMTFSISPHATLSFADAVGGGTVVFSANSGSGVLDVGDLSSFNPTGIKNLNIGVGANTETTVIDFINAGTNATATLSNQSTTGATLNVFADGTSHDPADRQFHHRSGRAGQIRQRQLSVRRHGRHRHLLDPFALLCGGYTNPNAQRRGRRRKFSNWRFGNHSVSGNEADQVDRAAQLFRPLRLGRSTSCRSASRPARSMRTCRSAICGFRRIMRCISTAC